MPTPSNEKLKHIEQFAEMLLSKKEVATNMGFDPLEFQTNPEMAQAYTKGHQKAITSHKKKIVSLAAQGSSPAQTHLEKLRLEIKLQEIKDAWE